MPSGEPPWYFCSGNAAACAKPPSPTVSVIGLSPPIQVISSLLWPLNSTASTVACGPVNQRSPRPATLMEKPLQLNAIALTTLQRPMPLIASAVALAAAIESRRKK